MVFESASGSDTLHAENDRTVDFSTRDIESRSIDKRAAESRRTRPRPKSRKSLSPPVVDHPSDNARTPTLDDVQGLFGELSSVAFPTDLDFELDLPSPASTSAASMTTAASDRPLSDLEPAAGNPDSIARRPAGENSAPEEQHSVLADEPVAASIDESLSDRHDWIDDSPQTVPAWIDTSPAPRFTPPSVAQSQSAAKSQSVAQSQKSHRPPRERSRLATLVVRCAISLAVIAGGVLTIQWASSPSLDDIEATLVRLQKECVALRAAGPSPTDWNRFTERARLELDEYVPWLETAAVPGERRISLLLYASRDLSGMIELSPDAEVPWQRRLDGFIQQLGEMSQQ